VLERKRVLTPEGQPTTGDADKGAWSSRLRQGWPVIAIALLVAIFFRPVLLPNQVIVPADLLVKSHPWKAYNPPDYQIHNFFASDIIDSQYPARAVAVGAVRAGQLPLWDPYTSSGRPLGTLPIYALELPLNILLVLFPLDVGFSYVAMARLFIAGVAMYAFLRQLELSEIAALVGGVAFAFSGFMIVWLNATAGITLSMAPLTFWAEERLLRKPTAGRVTILALSVAVLISGGFLQIVLYTLYSLAGYTIFRVVMETAGSRQWKEGLRKLAWSGAAVTAGIALMAPQLWAFWDHLRLTSYESQRATQHRGLGAEPLYQLIRYVLPNYYGSPVTRDFVGMYPERTGYVGIAPLLLVPVAFLSRRRRRRVVWYFAFLGLLSFGMVFGAPFNRLVASLPGMMFSSSTRFKSVIALCVPVLAAFGLDSLLEGSEIEGQRKAALGAMTLTVLFQIAVLLLTERFWSQGGAGWEFDRTLLSLWQAGQRWLHPRFKDLLRCLLWTLGTLVLTVASLKRFIPRRWLGLGTLLILSLDLIGWGAPYYRPADRAEVYPTTPGIAFLQNDPDLFRVTGLDGAFFPNTPGVYNLQDIAGHDPLATDRYRRYLERIDQQARFGVHGTVMRLHSDTANVRSPLLDVLNVKYLVAAPSEAADDLLESDDTFRRVYRGEDLVIYENTDVLPRCFVVFQAEVVPDPESALDRLAEGRVDPRETVILEETPPEQPAGTRPPGSEPPQVTSYTANYVSVQVSVEQPAFLVLGDMYYPGWEARLDGQPTEIYRADYLFRAVSIPPGTHTVEFHFRPTSYMAGQALRVVLLLGLIAANGWAWSRRMKGSRADA